MTHLFRLTNDRRSQRRVYFSRGELFQLLTLYSSRVSSGEWRDYAIDYAADAAVFSVFRHTHDRPLFAVAKSAESAGGQPDYALFNGLRTLARGPRLGDVLAVIERTPRLVREP